MLDTTTLAIIGYAAYAGEANYLTYDGKKMPTWEELGPQIQARWIANAEAIKETIEHSTQGDHK